MHWQSPSRKRSAAATVVVFFFHLAGIVCAARRTNETTNRDRSDGKRWISAPSRAGNDYLSIYHQGMVFDQDHKEDIPDGNNFYQPYEEYDDWVEPRKDNTQNEIRAIPQISLYSCSKRQPITYQVQHALRTNETTNRDRSDGEQWIGAPSRADNNYSSIYPQDRVFDQDHKEDIPDEKSFYQPYEEYNDWVEPRKDNTKNEIRAIPQIGLYSRSKRKWITYQVLHRFWTSYPANAYSVKTFNMKENQPPIVNAVLKILWTMDEKDMAENIRLIVVREWEGEKLPRWPEFVDATGALNREDRLRIIRSTLQEAFDYWSAILFNRVIFEYVPYDSKLKNSPDFDRVVTIGMKDMIHVDEHSNFTDSFGSKIVLAHASVNFVHFNREGEGGGFYIAPHLTSKRVYIAIEDNSINANAEITKLHEISSEALAKRYRMRDYKDLYRRSKAFFEERRLFYKDKQRLNCMICVAIHEVGHVMGLGHTDERDSVMFGVVATNEVIYNNDDMTVFRQFYAGLLDGINRIEMRNWWSQCSRRRRSIR